MNKELDLKLKEIINYIKNNENYKNYLITKNLLEKEIEVKILIEQIKVYQKEIVYNKDKEKELQTKIDECLEKLNKNYLYNEYLKYLEEVNNMINIFENKINKYFYDLFN